MPPPRKATQLIDLAEAHSGVWVGAIEAPAVKVAGVVTGRACPCFRPHATRRWTPLPSSMAMAFLVNAAPERLRSTLRGRKLPEMVKIAARLRVRGG